MSERVNIDNFRAAETARMFDSFVAASSGVNRFTHFRAPTPVESQPVIRMNRDTLYSIAVVDISRGATLTVPDAGGRYLSVMAVNAEHYINEVYREPGTHEITMADHGTRFVALAARTFVDPADPDDVAAVNALQDQIGVTAVAEGPSEHPEFDEESLDATRKALAKLGAGLSDATRSFGPKAEVEPTRHLIGTAVGWGGLPEHEAYYMIEAEPRPIGEYTITLRDVPVDAFWSVSVYNRDGYFEPNPEGTFSVNSVTSEPEVDGSVVVNLSPEAGAENHIRIMDGWNYVLRLYRPRAEILDGTWTAPTPQPA